MPIHLGPALKTFSHSALSVFETCPKQFEHIYILKDVSREDTEETLWGSKVHKELEDYATVGSPVKQDICAFGAKIIDATRNWEGGTFAENKFGLTADYKPTDFYSTDAALRGVIDYGAINGNRALLVDYKTGKMKDDFKQMQIFTVAAFAMYPQLEKVKASYVWLKYEQTTDRVFERTDLPSLIAEVEDRVSVVRAHVEAGNFPMKPSGLCRGWCPVKSCVSYKEPSR